MGHNPSSHSRKRALWFSIHLWSRACHSSEVRFGPGCNLMTSQLCSQSRPPAFAHSCQRKQAASPPSTCSYRCSRTSLWRVGGSGQACLSQERRHRKGHEPQAQQRGSTERCKQRGRRAAELGCSPNPSSHRTTVILIKYSPY